MLNASREEVRAVMLHEIHHRKNKDPLRSLLLDLARDAFFYLPIGGWQARRFHHMRELAADDAVLNRTGAPLELASALLKVAWHGNDVDLRAAQPASIIGGRGGGSAEGRIRRLVEGTEERMPRAPFRVYALSLIIACALILSISLPLRASNYDPGYCDMKTCAPHVDEMGESCTVHCDITM